METLTDQYKCEQYKEMSLDTADENVLNEIFENEILDSSAKTAAKLSLLKPPRQVSSNGNIHYDLKNLPKFHHGYIVQVNCCFFHHEIISIFSFINIWNIV